MEEVDFSAKPSATSWQQPQVHLEPVAGARIAAARHHQAAGSRAARAEREVPGRGELGICLGGLGKFHRKTTMDAGLATSQALNGGVLPKGGKPEPKGSRAKEKIGKRLARKEPGA